ncbi:MAG TPA: zinc finger domain-containing protein, partial [Lentisphaeria bacterium]|nr:zinc finger domain-containing protein [Lentisphaeria bacterium]
QDLDKSVPPPLANLGPEPLTADFTPAGLYTATRNRNTPIKNFIMAQENVVGVGNIYASEALFRARLSPLKPASTLSRTACRNLTAAIKAVLTEAIAAGGTTISDFHALDGSEGKFTVALQVYGRNGQPCPVCGQAIQRLVIAGRSSFFCKKCQKP